MKIHSVGTELLHEDRQADKAKLTVTFHNAANVPNKETQTCSDCHSTYLDEEV